MNKQEAIKRLDVLDNEDRKLRKIIEQGDERVYDGRKIYIGIKDGTPYIMVGKEIYRYFRFHCFTDYKTEQGWTRPKETGQECLDYHLAVGFDIRAFGSTREAFQYFLDNLKE
jgi:hypothetical protein